MRKPPKPNPRKFIALANEDLQMAAMSKRFNKAVGVAVMSGPAVVIESIVWKAEQQSGIPMDWSYGGGRAFIYALGDVKKARSALYCALPQSDLTPLDL